LARIDDIYHCLPTLSVLEGWAEALGVKPHQLFFFGRGKPEAQVLRENLQVSAQDPTFFGLFGQVPGPTASPP
jgi:hypothetical protein